MRTLLCCLMLCGMLEGVVDFTRPVNKLDSRLRYQKIDSSCATTVVAWRFDQAFKLPASWKASLRLETPYTWLNCKEIQEEEFDSGGGKLEPLPEREKHAVVFKENGLADWFARMLLITPTYGAWTYAFGLQAVFPTASRDELGSGRYSLRPTFGVKYDLSCWMKGAWMGALIRDGFDVGGRSGRPHIHILYLQPFFVLDLPDNWFIYTNPVATYNWIRKKWFVPIGAAFGNRLGDKWMLTLSYRRPVVRQQPTYEQQIEFILGYIF